MAPIPSSFAKSCELPVHDDGKAQTELGPLPHHLRRRRTISSRAMAALTFTALFLLLWFSSPLLASSRRDATVPGLGVNYTAAGLQSQVCQLRFWRNRHASYCDGLSEAQIWMGEAGTTAARAPLEVFEVDPPVRVEGKYLPAEVDEEEKETECELLLMQHTFGFSYGIPFVGNYTPPSCSWTNIFLTLSMTSQGRQYDRLALMFLGDTEVFRTSTAEPTSYGIVTHYEKDMTRFSALFREPQTLIFDLGNLVNDIYTGSFNVTMTATFYTPQKVVAAEPADQILPISANKGSTGQPSHWHLPVDNAVSEVTLPGNTVRAVVGVSATGNSQEEFWYTNVPSEYANTWSSAGTTLYGYSAFREVQVLVDGALAGVAWPFFSIYTGGINPALWRPIVAITAYDLPEYEVDISPFLPLLLDGQPHSIEFKVASYDSETGALSSGLGSDWLVSGRVFIWQSAASNFTTTGEIVHALTPDPSFSYSSQLEERNGTNATLSFELSARRSLSFSSILTTEDGGTRTVSWTQGLAYVNTQTLSDTGNSQTVKTTTSGTDSSAYGSRHYRYPLDISTTYDPDTSLPVNIVANVTQGLERQGRGYWSWGSAAGTGSVDTTYEGEAGWKLNAGGNGTAEQTYRWRGALENREGVSSYQRRVKSVNLVNQTWVENDWEVVNGVQVD